MSTKPFNNDALERAKRALGVSPDPPLTDKEFLKQQPRQIKTKEKDVWAEAAKQVSENTLRVPKTPDREEPERFNPWVDIFGQSHGEIDWDAQFQSYAFDPHLGKGTNPLGEESGSERPSHAGGKSLENDEAQTHIRALMVEDPKTGKTNRVRTGLLEGDREIKMRQPNKRTWWIFYSACDHLEEFLKKKYPRDDDNNREKAARALFVLTQYYLRNRQDCDIAALGSNEWSGTFQDEKSVKRFRQELVVQGVEMFGENKEYVRGPREKLYPNAKRFVVPHPGGQHGG